MLALMQTHNRKIKAFRVNVLQFIQSRLMRSAQRCFEIWGTKYIFIERMKLVSNEFVRIQNQDLISRVTRFYLRCLRSGTKLFGCING
jgi:hypothetical protein